MQLLEGEASEANAGRDGGAVFSAEPGSSVLIPTYVQCEFIANIAGDEGGAIHNFSISPAFLECVFQNNFATASHSFCIHSPIMFPQISDSLPTHLDSFPKRFLIIPGKLLPFTSQCI